MIIWIDCEWNDYKGELISIALIDERQCAFYGVLQCLNPSPWVQMNVMPHLRDQPRKSLFELRDALRLYLVNYHTVHIIADWPEDIKHFCDLLITGPGLRIATPPLTMEVRRDINSDASLFPHNAIEDVLALREMYMKTT